MNITTNSGIMTLREYPDPRNLPAQPSWQQPLPQLTPSELIPGQYVSTTYSRKESSDVRYFAFCETIGLLQTGGIQPSRECVSIYL
jgi:hypothetical protein